jgi:hypothetical protein
LREITGNAVSAEQMEIARLKAELAKTGIRAPVRQWPGDSRLRGRMLDCVLVDKTKRLVLDR